MQIQIRTWHGSLCFMNNCFQILVQRDKSKCQSHQVQWHSWNLSGMCFSVCPNENPLLGNLQTESGFAAWWVVSMSFVMRQKWVVKLSCVCYTRAIGHRGLRMRDASRRAGVRRENTAEASSYRKMSIASSLQRNV